MVLAGVAVLVALPTVVRRWPVSAAELAPTELAARVATSVAQPYSGTVAARGGLGLPDLPTAQDRAELFGSATRLRTWYLHPDAWRVDTLDTVGERGTYRDRRGLLIWESARRLVRRIDDEPDLRLPRAADLVPPELARRLLAGTEPDELRPLAAARVAGRPAPGLRIVPRDPASSVARVDIWADAATGVALRVVVTPRASSVPVLETTFLDISLSAPDPDVVVLEAPPDAAQRREGADDPLAEIGRRSSIPLPATLAGLGRTSVQQVGVATYGDGLTSVTVAGVPGWVLGQLVPASLPLSERAWGGSARLLETPLLNAMAITRGGDGFVLAGAVSVGELDRIAAALASR